METRQGEVKGDEEGRKLKKNYFLRKSEGCTRDHACSEGKEGKRGIQQSQNQNRKRKKE